MIVTASPRCCVGCSLVRSKRLFLRPDLALSWRRARAASNPPSSAGPEPRAAPAWGRAWRGPTICHGPRTTPRLASRRGAPISHGHIRAAVEPRRWPPDRDRSSPEAPPRWRLSRRLSGRASNHAAHSAWTASISANASFQRFDRLRRAAAVGRLAGSGGRSASFWRDGAPGVRRCSARRDLRANGLWAWLFSVT